MQEVWVQPLVRELRSAMPHSQKKKQNIKWKQYCDKFNKNFKDGPHQKNILKRCKDTKMKGMEKDISQK